MSLHSPAFSNPGPVPAGVAGGAPEAPVALPATPALAVKLDVSHVGFQYGTKPALKDVTLPVYDRQVTAFIGPSGCGKSTLLRVFNRMYDLYPDQKTTGHVFMDGVDILGRQTDPIALRARIGMVFQKPTPFPMSIFDNVAMGIRVANDLSKSELEGRVEDALRRAALWEEVKDCLKKSGTSLSGGQQQRLCIARTIAVRPEVILLDEPCSALDPITTAKIEDLIDDLKREYTIVIVTHNLQQAARVADYTAFMYLGEVGEFGPTMELFNTPRNARTQAYVEGRFG